ncbi:MAG: MFS transporter [Gemmatimonadota bacterium]|nr:MFS transporter [Gemmatimonadota bacterium]
MNRESQNPLLGAVVRITGVRPEEAATVLLSAAYFFLVLSAYYVLRPIRDSMGVAGGPENLHWLFTATAAVMLLLHPVFAAIVARWTRRRFVAVTYRFFMLCLIVFFLVLNALPEGGQAEIWVGRSFFVWTSVFNLFVVSVFWSFMTDLYRERQSRRLFALIGVGGTMGAILGSSITAFFTGIFSEHALLWFSILLLEGAVFCVKGLDRRAEALKGDGAPAAPGAGEPGSDGEAGSRGGSDDAPNPGEKVIGGSPLEGIARVLRSPYLLGICVFLILFTTGSAYLYGMVLSAVDLSFPDDTLHAAIFARMDLAVNILTLLTQLFLTGRIVKRLGVAVTLALLPLLSVVGFLALAVAPVFAVVVVFNVLRRAGNFAVAVPMREVLYTVLPRNDKYKAKNFNDTFMYRTGDLVGIWSFGELGKAGLGTSALAWVMVPVAGLWVMVSVWLGRRQKVLAGGSAPIVRQQTAG